jgi:hypothetical protein
MRLARKRNEARVYGCLRIEVQEKEDSLEGGLKRVWVFIVDGLVAIRHRQPDLPAPARSCPRPFTVRGPREYTHIQFYNF